MLIEIPFEARPPGTRTSPGRQWNHDEQNHRVDQHGDGNVDVAALAELHAAHGGDDAGQRFAHEHADDHAESDPRGQVSLKQTKAFWLHLHRGSRVESPEHTNLTFNSSPPLP